MAITYFAETETLANSRPLILENDRTLLSNSKGTSYPVVNTEVGQFFYHETEFKLYQLKTKTPTDTWVQIADLSGTPITQQAADARYATINHAHTYNVDNNWLRRTNDSTHVLMYGNSRQIIFRTDGVTEYVPGIGTFPFLFMYGGDALANRIVGYGADGSIWTKTYGWLQHYFLSKSVTSTLSSGVAIYAQNGAWSGDAPAQQGKLQYCNNQWYVNAAPDASNIAVFRRGGVDKLAIDGEGFLYSTALGNYYHLLFAPRTSTNRPGVTKLYRADVDDGFYLSTFWVPQNNRWKLNAYAPNGNYHAEVEVGYAYVAGSTTRADVAGRAEYADYATPRVLPTRVVNCQTGGPVYDLRVEGYNIVLYMTNCSWL